MTKIMAVFAMLLIIAGCNQGANRPLDAEPARRWTTHRPPLAPEDLAETTASAPEAPPGKGPEDLASAAGVPVRSFNTGDSRYWPRYDFPLVIDVEVPAVPPGIAEPAPAIPDP